MELSYLNQPLPKTDRRLSLAVLLVTLGATFALWEFPVYFLGLLIIVVFVAGVYNFPELGIAVLLNGLYLVGFFWRGFQITYLVTPLAVALCTVGLAHYVLNNGLRWRFGVLPGIVVLIGLMLFVGILYSPSPSEGLVRAGKYLSLNFYIFFAATLFIEDVNKQKNLLTAVALLGIAAATVSIFYIAYAGVETVTRFALPAQNPIWFARGMGISLLATLFLWELTKKKLERFIYIIFMSIMLFMIYIAASRGPALALLITLFFYFFVLQRKRFGFFKKVLFILFIFISLGLSIAVAPQHIWNRMVNVFSGFDITTFYRLQAYEIAEELFFGNPIGGVGTGGFKHFNVMSYPHNIFLEFASEHGILGLSLFLIFVIYAGYLGIKLVRSHNASGLELNLRTVYLAMFNYELWFSVAGIWTLYATKRRSSKR
jgi:O-antigen ligase